MKKYQLKDKKNITFLKKLIAKQKKEDTINTLVDSTIFFDKLDNVLVLNLFKINKNNLINYILELSKISTTNDICYENKVSCCEFLAFENTPKNTIYINFIGTSHEKYLGKGYNYITLRALEQFAIEHKIDNLYGLFLPLPPGNFIQAVDFYSRNKFSFYTDKYGEDRIIKEAKDFRELKTSKISGLKFAENLFYEETETDNLEK